MNIKLSLFAATALTGASPATAAPTIVAVNKDLATGPFSFSFGGATFTFSATGDVFNPIAVKTAGSGAVNSYGGFLGVPLTPTSNFTDRGTVTFGPGDKFDPFPTTTTVPFSNNANFIGLRAGTGTNFFYGFAYTVDSVFKSYGFETVANQAITATTAATSPVPEPTTWSLMIIGFGVIGGAMRHRRPKARVTFA